MQGLNITELLKNITDEVTALDIVHDCDIYGGDITDGTILNRLGVRVRGSQSQCFLQFGIGNINDNKQSCSNSSAISSEAAFSLIIFGNLDKDNNTKGFSSVACNTAQKIAGLLNKNKFGFTDQIENYPVILNLSPIGDTIKDKINYQIWQVAWTQKIRLNIT